MEEQVGGSSPQRGNLWPSVPPTEQRVIGANLEPNYPPIRCNLSEQPTQETDQQVAASGKERAEANFNTRSEHE